MNNRQKKMHLNFLKLLCLSLIPFFFGDMCTSVPASVCDETDDGECIIVSASSLAETDGLARVDF